MGKAKIIGGGEDGLYTVEVLLDRDQIEAEMEQIKEKITEFEAQEDQLVDEIETLEIERSLEIELVRQNISDIHALAESVG